METPAAISGRVCHVFLSAGGGAEKMRHAQVSLAH